MLQATKRIVLFFVVLFLWPLFIGQLPLPNNELSTKDVKEQPIVYANSEHVEESITSQQQAKALILFTHSHEAYKPVVEKQTGLEAVYSEEANIVSLEQVIAQYFLLNGIETQFLGVDIAEQMKLTNQPFREAYNVARPYIQSQLAKDQYDIIIDFHRDAVTKEATTAIVDNVPYAKVAFIVGAAHPSYSLNYALANELSATMNESVTGISRGVFQKSGIGVDGIYNQDLAPNMVLIELGGIDNTEEELLRTLAVIAKTISQTLTNEQLSYIY